MAVHNGTMLMALLKSQAAVINISVLLPSGGCRDFITWRDLSHSIKQLWITDTLRITRIHLNVNSWCQFKHVLHDFHCFHWAFCQSPVVVVAVFRSLDRTTATKETFAGWLPSRTHTQTIFLAWSRWQLFAVEWAVCPLTEAIRLRGSCSNELWWART